MKENNKFVCESCVYETERWNDWNKHLNTKKHIIKVCLEENVFICACGKRYK